jgi:hypothetical protein
MGKPQSEQLMQKVQILGERFFISRTTFSEEIYTLDLKGRVLRSLVDSRIDGSAPQVASSV